MKNTIAMLFFSATMALAATLPVHAAEEGPLLAQVFQDNMVLQRDIAAPVWGWAKSGTKITVEIAGKRASGTADASGKWMVRLPPLPVGGPYTLKVTGPESRELTNILVGDVWICSGQSNMEMGIGAVNDAPKEIASADNPQIRLLTVAKKVALTPQDSFSGNWEVCTPKTVSAGGWAGFSAVGYFFGRELQERLHVPIGLIHTSWGGTIAEAWTSAEALNRLDDFRPRVAQVAQAHEARVKGQADFQKVMDAWWAKNDPGHASQWQSPTWNDGDWKTMRLPSKWEEQGLPDFDGIVWFRRTVDVPAADAGKEATLHLGPIDDRDQTFVNGVPVGGMNMYNQGRDYMLPAGTLKPGPNVIAVAVLDTGGAGGIWGTPDQMKLEIVGGASIPLAGEWKYQVAADLKKVEAAPAIIGDDPNVSTVLYNGMVAPLVPFGIKGAIWYQGESNAGRAYQYRTLLPTLIRDWRQRFGVGDFPFFIVQLANFQEKQKKPGDDAWAELREAQLMTAQTVGHSGIAVTIDIGDAGDIHPKDKQDVSKRLALQALNVAYGQKKIVPSGPIYKGMKKVGGTIHLAFDNVGGGLVPKGDRLEGFAISGADRKFVWADAMIVGNEIVVTAPSVPDPVAVRYAWAINPLGNLYNREGLPASPFRTDDWPGITVNNH